MSCRPRATIDIDKAIRMYRDEGLPTTVVSKAVGCCVQTLNSRLRQHGVAVRSAGFYKQKVDFETIRHEYEDLGMTMTAIANKHGMNPTSVFERLKKAGVRLRERVAEWRSNHEKIPESEHRVIRRRYVSGTEHCGKIARDYGVHRSTIHAILKKGGVTLSHAGARNPYWKGGCTKLHDRIRNHMKAQAWRRACMERDDFTCRMTGQRGGKLHVHHIRSFSTILAEFLACHADLDPERDVERLLSLSLDFAPLWDLDNGMTLLASAHRRLHANHVDPALAVQVTRLKEQGWSTHRIAMSLRKSWHVIDRVLRVTAACGLPECRQVA